MALRAPLSDCVSQSRHQTKDAPFEQVFARRKYRFELLEIPLSQPPIPFSPSFSHQLSPSQKKSLQIEISPTRGLAKQKLSFSHTHPAYANFNFNFNFQQALRKSGYLRMSECNEDDWDCTSARIACALFKQ